MYYNQIKKKSIIFKFSCSLLNNKEKKQNLILKLEIYRKIILTKINLLKNIISDN